MGGGLRPGGKWTSDSERIDGTQKGNAHGEYLQVEPPHLLVFTWQASFDNSAETLIRCELKATAKGTHVKIVHSGFGDRTASAMGHNEGWKRVLGWLSAHRALR